MLSSVRNFQKFEKLTNHLFNVKQLQLIIELVCFCYSRVFRWSSCHRTLGELKHSQKYILYIYGLSECYFLIAQGS